MDTLIFRINVNRQKRGVVICSSKSQSVDWKTNLQLTQNGHWDWQSIPGMRDITTRDPWEMELFINGFGNSNKKTDRDYYSNRYIRPQRSDFYKCLEER